MQMSNIAHMNSNIFWSINPLMTVLSTGQVFQFSSSETWWLTLKNVTDWNLSNCLQGQCSFKCTDFYIFWL